MSLIGYDARNTSLFDNAITPGVHGSYSKIQYSTSANPKETDIKEIIASKFHLRIYVRFQDKTCGSFAVNMITIGGNIRDKVPTIGLTIS